MKRYIFGAGNIGLQILELMKRIHLTIECFFDNDEKKWGTSLSEIPVTKFDPAKLLRKDYVIYAACGSYQEVVCQLRKAGIPNEKIIIADYILSDALLENIGKYIVEAAREESIPGSARYDVLLDLSGGAVLGGVEQWNYSFAGNLEENGISGAYLVVKSDNGMAESTGYPLIVIHADSDIVDFVKKIISANAKTIICNFPLAIFKAACMVKRYYDRKLNVIAIVHSDLDLYYKTYAFWGGEIDYCYGISSKIMKQLNTERVLEKKLCKLHWLTKIPVRSHGRYSDIHEPINIGYAGRLVRYPKRLDRIIPLARKLIEKGINFRIHLAGEGEYRSELENTITENGLQKYVQVLGCLSHEQVQLFWLEQDLFLNCSDYEGHSISQSEAVAAGTVPVVMDVSGASDDIEDGKNGFIVPVGDVEMMAERISWLYHHREALAYMGDQGRRKISLNNKLAEGDIGMLIERVIRIVD